MLTQQAFPVLFVEIYKRWRRRRKSHRWRERTGAIPAVDCPVSAGTHVHLQMGRARMHASMRVDTYTQAVDGNPIWQACIPVQISKAAKANRADAPLGHCRNVE